jgi:hypothetical protein
MLSKISEAFDSKRDGDELRENHRLMRKKRWFTLARAPPWSSRMALAKHRGHATLFRSVRGFVFAVPPIVERHIEPPQCG